MKVDVMVNAIMGYLREIIMSNKYVFHLLGLVHLPNSKEYAACAFTNKNIKMARWLCSMGHTVYMYGAKTTNPKYDLEEYVNSDKFRFIETHTVQDIRDAWGEGDNRYEEIGYDFHTRDFKHDLDSERTSTTMKFYKNAIDKINTIKKPDDFLLCTQGFYHKPIADAVKLFLTCDSSIGFRGSNKDWFRCFESNSLQNFTYGSEKPHASQNGRNYDRVIANWFDEEDVMFSAEKDDYYLFIGRLIRRKGIVEACLASKIAGIKLKIVGQCGRIDERGHLLSTHPNEFDIAPDFDWEYLGFKGIEEKKKIMAHAKGVFCNTTYIEAFGGVHCEAGLSGSGFIGSRWGIFGDANTFVPGVHGFQCSSLDDLIFAINSCPKLDPYEIRRNAERFLSTNIRWQYEEWWEDLYQLYLSTTDNKIKGWHYVWDEIPEYRKHLYPNLTKE